MANQEQVDGFAEVKDEFGDTYRATNESDDPDDIVVELIQGKNVASNKPAHPYGPAGFWVEENKNLK